MTTSEPIAIIGMACRFAGGVDSLESFWSLLREGRDTVGVVPPERWQWYATQGSEFARAVRDVTSKGSFLHDVAGFDADFFDLTPREAALMDPQQRIVLELAWEALEHAGIPPHRLAGTDTGVFMGLGADDYGRRLLEDLPRIEAWTGIGGAYCGVANRVSYLLDLRGASMAVDTACSSSLVAIHLAAQALRAGECPVALAGGVLVMAAPGLSLVLDAAGATSPDGRCKSFDVAADGYGRGEGGGVIVLKRLSDARRDRDRVLAVIRGSAVHQDGRTKGIMAPSGQAQSHVMRRAYEAAGLDPSTVDYVEAHGTGTRAGDPIEAAAMASVFGLGRDTSRPCLIGSVKPNIGHIEAGAGVAGVIKTVLALAHGEIPASLNVTTPNPAIDWDTAGLRVVTETTPWPGTAGPRRAGVSGYGYGGTVAHVVLERDETPTRATVTKPARAPHPSGELYPLSGASQAAVERYADRLAEHLTTHGETDLADVGHTLALRRTHLPHRAAVYATGRAQLISRLRELGESGAATTGTVLSLAGRGLVWVFSGHGSQWIGMTRELLAEEPVFAGVIDQLEPVFRAEMGLSPRACIRTGTQPPVDVIQPMIFAVQVALGATWRARGVRPDAVIGHSVGEIAAAVTAGILTLTDGARLVCRRSLLLREVAGQGAMLMVDLPADEAHQRLGDRAGLAVAVAAGTRSAVISGDIPAVEEIGRLWRAEGRDVRTVDSNVAFHSPHMDRLLGPLVAAVGDLPSHPPRIPVYSTALADPRSDVPRDSGYWAANLRGQVRFVHAVTAAVEDGYRLFVEVSAHPVVEHSINETLDALGVDACVAHTLRRNRPERETMLANLGVLHCHGAEVDFSALWPGGELVALPTPAWQRRPLWAPQPPTRSYSDERHDPGSHTLLGRRTIVNGVTPAQSWLTTVDRASRPYPGDHVVRDVEIVPAAVLLNTFLSAGSAMGAWPDLSDVALRVPVSVTVARELQVVVQDGWIRLSSRIADGADDDKGWVTHTTAAIEPGSDVGGRSVVPADEELPVGHVVARLATLGVDGMGFDWAVDRIQRGDGTLVAEVRGGTGSPDTPATWASIMDAALSVASVSFPGPPILRMPAHIHRVSLAVAVPNHVRVVVRVIGDQTVDVEITDLSGTVVGRFTRLRYGVLGSDAGAITNPRQLVHAIGWQPAPRQDPTDQMSVVLIGTDTALLGRLTEHIASEGFSVRSVAGPDQVSDAELLAGHVLLVVAPPTPPGEVAASAATAAWLLARTAQRLAGAGLIRPARLWCVTRGVWEAAEEESLGDASLWGLGRIIGGEHPRLWGGIVDIGRSAPDLAGLTDVLRTVRGEDVVVLRDGRATVARLHRLAGEPVRTPVRCQPDGTYLITGGLGVLGLATAHYLADRGARRLVLAGRRGMPPRHVWDTLTDFGDRARVDAIRSLERLGVTVVTVAADIADERAVAALLAPGALGLPPVRGVVHAAGVLDDRTLRALDEESLRAVMRPKVSGAWVLHRLFPPGCLDFFVLFSSCGQLLGLPGQASYGSANAFLDALATHRRAAGDVTTSFGWTSWRGLGMSTATGVIEAELAARGTADISLTEAFSGWEWGERYDHGYVAVLRITAPEPGQRRLAVLSEIPVDAAQGPEADDAAMDAAAWSGLAGPELHAWLVAEVRGLVASETRLATSEVDIRRPLVEMGIDSVMTVRIRRALERRFRQPFPATLFWDRPSVDAVVGLLVQLLGDVEVVTASGEKSR